jgi:hypothetical protein
MLKLGFLEQGSIQIKRLAKPNPKKRKMRESWFSLQLRENDPKQSFCPLVGGPVPRGSPCPSRRSDTAG